MALNKTPINIPFSQGVQTKTDVKQLPIGQFANLKNTIFDNDGLLQKRNGYQALTPIGNSDSTQLTTFNGNLLAIGDTLKAYSQGSGAWTSSGALQPVSVDVLSLVRSNTNQSACDSVVAPNGLVCTVFTDNIPTNGVNVASYKYVISDSTTGQNVIAPTVIPVAGGAVGGTVRVFLLGSYFIIVLSAVIAAADSLRYIAISTINPTNTSNASISTSYVPNAGGSFDGIVANNRLYLAWCGTSSTVKMTSLAFTLAQSNVVTFTSQDATHMSVTADNSGSTAIIYASFYDTGSGDGYTLAVDHILNTVLAPTKTISSITVRNIVSTAQNAVCTVFYEVINAYTYDSTIATDYVRSRTCTQAGVLGTAATVDRGISLASKAFLLDGVTYMLAAYGSSFQPTYFLINGSGNVISKLAYSNGAVAPFYGLTNVTLTGNEAQMAYLIKDQIQAVNKTQGVANTVGIYSQTGVNLVSFDIGSSVKTTSEIGSALHLTGGFLWMYDGLTPVEHGFHLWPDSVETLASTGGGSMAPQQYFYQATYEWSDNQGMVHRSAPSIPVTVTPVASVNHTFADTDVNTGTERITVTGHGYSTGTVFTLTNPGTLPTPFVISTNYYVIRIDANTIQVATSLALALAGTPINITNAGSGTNTIHVGTNQNSVAVYVPTLRLTYKIANPVKIVLYRWSTAQQVYYQTTSILTPVLNDTTVDYVTITDTNSDAQILGNNILYTTGGVLENIEPGAIKTMTLWQGRLVVLNSEDRNLLGLSKQVIEGVPVEMTNLLTLYVAPTIGSQGSTGPIETTAAMDEKLIVFKDNAIYYFNGQGPDNTGANSQIGDPVFITSTVGCSNQASIVFMPNGLMFQSDKGIWLLGRDLATTYIGAPVQGFTQNATVLSAVSVPNTNQIRFTLDSGITLMYDYYYNRWGTFVNIPAISSTLYEGLHTYLNDRGEVFQETPSQYLDGSNPVLMSFTTGWINPAGLQGFLRAYEMYIMGTYISPHKLQVQIAYDYNSNPSQSTVFTPDNYVASWGGEQLWGSNGPWGGPGNIENWRIFFDQQKCSAFQITINEIFDPSYGTTAGAGLTMSGINMTVGLKDSKPRLRGSRQTG